MINCKVAIEGQNECIRCCQYCEHKCVDCCLDVVDDPEVLTCPDEVSDTELVPFEEAYATVLKSVAEIETAKKSLEAQEKEMKVKLQAAMEEYGITSIDNQYFKVTYKKASKRTSIDSTKLKKELPDIAEKYSKISEVKASISIEVK